MRRLLLALLCVLACPALTVGCATEAPSRTGGRVTLEPDGPEDDFVIAKPEFDAIMARGPAWFIQRVAVRPVMVNGNFTGFQLMSLFSSDPDLETSALRPGDIVQRVNDQPIGRPEQFMAVWKSLADADHLAVQFVRDGRVLRVTWLIQPDVAASAATP